MTEPGSGLAANPFETRPARRGRGLARFSALDWRTSVPVAVLAMLVGCTAVFIRVALEYETTRMRDQQAADALWVEQTIRFQLARDEESLQLLANDVVHDHVSFAPLADRMEQLERSRHEFQRISWLAVPPPGTTAGPAPRANAQQENVASFAGLALQNGRPLYSQPYPIGTAQGRPVMGIDYMVPATDGVIVAVFSLDRVLTEMVPWWFAHKNEIQLLDASGTVLASRTVAGPGKNVYTHTTLLDESGASLYLRTDSTLDKPGIFTNALTGAVVLLSFTLIWSLYALRKDMSRRVRAEEQLSAEHAFRKAMDDSLKTGMRARDLEGKLTYANPAFCKMVGYEAAELIGCAPPMPYWAPDAIEHHTLSLRRTLAGSAPAEGFETVFLRKDGTRLQVLIHEAPLIDADGKHTGWMSSILDVTDRRRIEEVNRVQQEKLLTGSRLATMGEMTSTLSHELNQPLSAITSFATGCLNLLSEPRDEGGESDPGNHQVRTAIEAIHEQAVRAGMIVKSVHKLVKKREPSRQHCDLGEIVHGVMPLIELQAKSRNVVVTSHLDPAAMPIHGDSIMLEQVLLNLARNAIEVLQDMPVSSRRLEVSALIGASGETVSVTVADSGPGVSPQHVGQLFTPFFSTKAEGMGMGLSICRSAIEFHGGRIEYRIGRRGGAAFRFTLRLLPAKANSWPADSGQREPEAVVMLEGKVAS